ncbi:hypothetical protein BH10PSE3_BH10PSE3_21130 [soil metagenome]
MGPVFHGTHGGIKTAAPNKKAAGVSTGGLFISPRPTAYFFAA